MGFVLHPPASLFHHKVDEGSQQCLSSVIVFSRSNVYERNAKARQDRKEES